MENKKIDFATRQLMRSCSRGYLATNLSKENKNKYFSDINETIPYVTFVMTAFDHDGSPLLLLSDLSEHTKNLKSNDMVSILFFEENRDEESFPIFESNESYEDPMSRPRLTVIGRLKKSKKIEHKERFISRHSVSKLYSNFADMNLYKLEISGGHLTGGFAKVKWFNKDELTIKGFSGFSEDEIDIVKHMNEQHKESIKQYSKFFLDASNFENYNIVGIDPEGFDLRYNDKLKRISFLKKIEFSSELRKVFIKLHKQSEKKD